MKERLSSGMKCLLAAGLYIFLALTLAVLMLAPASAAQTVDTSAPSVEELAYMDLDGASPELRESILKARAQIIYTKSWTVDGAVSVIHQDGTVEMLPEFSDLFPGWDLGEIRSVFAQPNEPVTSEIADLPAGSYQAKVFLGKASELGNMGTFYGFAAQEEQSYAWAQYFPDGMDSCNIEFINLDTNVSEGLFTNLLPQQAVCINTRKNVRYGVRASSSSDSADGFALMRVSDDFDAVPEMPESSAKTSAWAKDTVNRAIEMGLVSSEYFPGDSKDFTAPIIREDFCTLALNYLALSNNNAYCFRSLIDEHKVDRKPDGQANNPFTDRTSTDTEFSAEDVTMCYYLNIVGGYADGSFGYGKTITRQEAAAILFRAYAVCGGELPETAAELTFNDKDTIQDWAKPNISALLEWKVMSGDDKGNFDPTGLCTYEQAIAMFLRLFDNAPVRFSNGNVKQMFTYEQCMDYLLSLKGVRGVRKDATVEGPAATFVRMDEGIMIRTSRLLLVYQNGGVREIKTEINTGAAGGIPASSAIENTKFSEDGKTFSCDIQASVYGTEQEYRSYHVEVNLDTMETVVTQM